MNTPMEFVASETTTITSALTGFALPEEEAMLAQRYQRKGLFERELSFEFTRDPGLLHQYFKIRAREFIDVMGLTSNYPDTETENDHNAHIMVVRMGNFCVGGARLHIKTPRKPNLLPIEAEGFRLEKYFPLLQHKQLSYGQVSGLVLLPDFRGGAITLDVFKRIRDKAIALNIHALFSACPLLNARAYMQVCNAIGLKDTKINWDIPVPPHKYMEEIKLYLMSSTMTSDRQESINSTATEDKKENPEKV